MPKNPALGSPLIRKWRPWLVSLAITGLISWQLISRIVAIVLHRLTEPALGPIRRVLPQVGGLDFSPLVLLIALQFLRRLL